MTGELVTVEITDNSPLKSYKVDFDRPERWEGKIADLQETYLSEYHKGTVRQFQETIVHLIQLAIKKHLVDPKEETIQQALAFAAMNMEQIFLLLVDPDVTEILSNKLGNDIIITHRVHGRCRTNMIFDNYLWDALKIRAEYDSGRPLNAANPALKIGLETILGNLRISLQVDPLSTHGPTFSIRRLPSSPIPLEQLIKEEQISKQQAELLTKALKRRENIIIAGEPGSGKTTLANALLLQSEKTWRLITLEDARELSIDSKKFPLLIQYRMPSVGSTNRFAQRSNEIARLLHRSPDYVFLGEIQTKEDTSVAFEGFAAGIRGMATTHARDIVGLQHRWLDSHNLPRDLMHSIDWIVITSRAIEEGKIVMGVEGIYKLQEGEFHQVTK